MSFAIDVCIKTAMLLVTASLLSWIARRASASLRHALWASALLAVLAFPLVVLVAPAINLVVLPAGFAASSVRPASVPPCTTTMEAIAIVQPAVAPPAPAPAPKKDWTFRLALLWMSGCLVVLLQSTLAFRELRRFDVGSRRPDDSWIALFTGMRQELSLSRLHRVKDVHESWPAHLRDFPAGDPLAGRRRRLAARAAPTGAGP